jgi:hypothetical protein
MPEWLPERIGHRVMVVALAIAATVLRAFSEHAFVGLGPLL